MTLDLNFQVFIGHSEQISQLLVSPDGQRVVSLGDAIFFWDFLAPSQSSSTPSLPPLPHNSSMFSVSPRVGPPVPTTFEPLKKHLFTPQPQPPSKERKKRVKISNAQILTVNGDDCSYSDDEEEEEGGRGGTVSEILNGVTIEGECDVRSGDSSESSSDGRSEAGGEVIIEHVSSLYPHLHVLDTGTCIVCCTYI